MDPVTRTFKTLFYLALLALLLLFLFSVSDLVKLMVVSALLAYVIDPAAVFLESRGMSRTTSPAVIFLSFSAIAAIFITLLLPLLTKEIAAIQSGISSGEKAATFASIDRKIQENLAFIGIKDFSLSNKLQGTTEVFSNWFFSHLLDIASLITNLVIIPFIVFFS